MIERWMASLMVEGRFWMVVVGAAVVKTILSERLGWKSVIASFVTAFFSAWVGTDPVMSYFELSDVYVELVAVTLALTGESLMRALILISNDPQYLKDIIAKRLGGRK